MIAGKTESEIILMSNNERSKWYKMILPDEKEEAMKIMRNVKRAKLSMANTGENNPMYGISIIHTEGTKAKMSSSKMGKNNPMYGKKRPLHSKRISGENNPAKQPEVRYKISTSHTDPEYRDRHSGKNHWNWKDGASFEPYCLLFNNEKREEIRNKYGRVCIVCGRSTLQNMDKNGKWIGRLDVDHVDENKMQGCDNWEWRLAPLCRSCHSKMYNRQLHLLLQLLLINNKLKQINLEVK